MGKLKRFQAHSKKKGEEKDKGPTTVDEYLAVGVDYEEAGEKWRAGDAAKVRLFSGCTTILHGSDGLQSTRFFIRALENYDIALEKYPDSFDIAYNKARVQYEITQHPTLATQIPQPLVDLLRTALESHRVALELRQENADVLFNTAQVQTSLAEALAEGRDATPDTKDEAMRLLEEAIELFQRCLSLQEYQFSESQMQMEGLIGAAEDQGTLMGDGTSTTAASLEASKDDRWAAIVEPVTQETLLDTSLAQLDTLTSLCGLAISGAGSGLAWIEEYSTSLIQNKISAFAKRTGRQKEVALVKANFYCALADVSFRTRQTDLKTYEKELFVAFNNEELGDITGDPEALSAKADALIAFCSAISDPSHAPKDLDPGMLSHLNKIRWNHLTLALGNLTTASKLPEARNIAKIHITRGDVEMLRFRLGQSPNSCELAQRNSEILLKNAGVYYKGAAGLARNMRIIDEAVEAEVKEMVAKGVGGDELALRALKHSLKDHGEILEEMVEEGLLDQEWALSIGG
ncbi:MAG: hypothetical protein M1840_001666 [Geoglossum simile]|nr:MAG: hypothetical protein M1840_001666 [Geoglossum simile]